MPRIMGEPNQLQIDHAKDNLRCRHGASERERPTCSNGGKGRVSRAVGLTSLFKDRSRFIEKIGAHATPPWVSKAQ